MIFDIQKSEKSIIKVIGVGGGGGNAVAHMFDQGIKGVDFAICNTDNQALDTNPVMTKIQLGPHLTEGRGAGTKPEIGKQACIESIEDVRNFLSDGTKMLFVTAGMGGGTGTGAAPIIAKAAKELDLLTVGIVTLPFKFEGVRRHNQALLGLEELKKNVDAILVISNDKLREIYGNLAISAAFAQADTILTTAAKGIAEIITVPGQVNVDFEDVNTVMRDSGVAMMGSASAEGEDRARKAIHDAINSPLLEDNDIRGAQHILLNITSGTKEVTMDEIGEITDYVQEEAGHGTDLVWGNCIDESLGDKISITLIATGFLENDRLYNSKDKTEKIVVSLDGDRLVNSNAISVGHSEGESSQTIEFSPRKFFRSEDGNYNSPEVDKKVFDLPMGEGTIADDQPETKKVNLDHKREKYLRDRSQTRAPYNPKSLAEIEKVPAFKRKNVVLDNIEDAEASQQSKYSLTLDEDQPIQRNNQFLYDNVD